MSDPSTYPIIAIMGTAMCFMVGMAANALTYKGVYVSPSKRGAILTTWGEEEKTGVTEAFVEFRGGVKAEGLGIDHEKWVKQKESYMQK